MPTTYAHNLFGKKVYQKLESPLQEMILRHRETYIIGLHGPDILFYTRPFQKNHINQMGQRLHREAAGFFEKGRKRLETEWDEEELVYLFGFICHFMLDSSCHPFINEYERTKGASHAEIETELDRALMEATGKDPFRYRPASIIHIKPASVRAISAVLEGTTEKEIAHTLAWMKFYTNITVCGPVKRKLLQGLAKGTVVYSMAQGRLMLKDPRPSCLESTKKLEALFEQAVPETVRMIEKYYDNVRNGGKLDARFERNYNN